MTNTRPERPRLERPAQAPRDVEQPQRPQRRTIGRSAAAIAVIISAFATWQITWICANNVPHSNTAIWGLWLVATALTVVLAASKIDQEF